MKLHEVSFAGGILKRGFWLYVWQITPPESAPVYYVGRTGDSSSTNAQSPFNRMGQHLGHSENSNMLRKHLTKQNIDADQCAFRLVALGPLEEESSHPERDEHDERRDLVAAMEKALAEAMQLAGYNVMNKVHSRKILNATRFAEVKSAFAKTFPKIM
tara:strand:+ start:6258 stop:6731 length:474 start_codon:yes stop_codon:yes gene_type:complete